MAACGSFNFEVAIRDFVADHSRDIFELPRLTTGQRKQAKRVAEEFPELRCETLGHGEDRRLTLLKGSAAAESTTGSATISLCTVPIVEDEQLDQEGTFDLEAMICEFLADPSRESLELPKLTTGQRKQARKLTEAHPELKCESFGLGADRRLHVFKVGDGNDQVHGNSKDASVVAPLLLPMFGTGDKAFGGECCSSASTCTSGRAGSTSSASLQVAAGSGGETPLPEGLQVRNTFICGVTEPFVSDERAVQSMPHGMFKQCLLDDLPAKSAKESRELEVVPASPVASPAAAVAMAFEPGVEVVIEGLTKLPAFNGLRGTVQSLDEASGRYDILLSSPAGSSGQQWAKVRGENLRPAALPEPPRFEPSLSVMDTAEGAPAEASYNEQMQWSQWQVYPAMDQLAYPVMEQAAYYAVDVATTEWPRSPGTP